jgi:hypothetical protein
MRRRIGEPYLWAVVVKPSHREPKTIQSWHQTRRAARIRRNRMLKEIVRMSDLKQNYTLIRQRREITLCISRNRAEELFRI